MSITWPKPSHFPNSSARPSPRPCAGSRSADLPGAPRLRPEGLRPLLPHPAALHFLSLQQNPRFVSAVPSGRTTCPASLLLAVIYWLHCKISCLVPGVRATSRALCFTPSYELSPDLALACPQLWNLHLKHLFLTITSFHLGMRTSQSRLPPKLPAQGRAGRGTPPPACHLALPALSVQQHPLVEATLAHGARAAHAAALGAAEEFERPPVLRTARAGVRAGAAVRAGGAHHLQDSVERHVAAQLGAVAEGLPALRARLLAAAAPVPDAGPAVVVATR